MSNTELSQAFSVGELVVYPTHGLCTIESKEERNGKAYLKVRVQEEGSVVLLPEANAGSLGLRHLSSPETIEEALAVLSDREKAITVDWKQRLNENQILMKEGTLASFAGVVNSLYRRSKVKELPSMERKLYDAALSMLVDEISSVLKKDQEETRRLIFSKLEVQ